MRKACMVMVCIGGFGILGLLITPVIGLICSYVWTLVWLIIAVICIFIGCGGAAIIEHYEHNDLERPSPICPSCRGLGFRVDLKGCKDCREYVAEDHSPRTSRTLDL